MDAKEMADRIRNNYSGIKTGAHFTAVGTSERVTRADGLQQGLVELTVVGHLDPTQQKEYFQAKYLLQEADRLDSPMGRAGLRMLSKLGDAVQVHAASAIGQKGSLSINVQDTRHGHKVTSVASAMNVSSGARRLEIGTQSRIKGGVTANAQMRHAMEDGIDSAAARVHATEITPIQPKGFLQWVGQKIGILPSQRHTLDLNKQYEMREELRYARTQRNADTRSIVLSAQAQRQADENPQFMTPAFHEHVFDLSAQSGAEYTHDLGVTAGYFESHETSSGWVTEATDWRSQMMVENSHRNSE